MRRARQAELARQGTESEDARAYVELAREIQQRVARIAADPEGDAAALALVFDEIDRDARLRIAREVFDRLSPEHQWAVIERVFDDAEIQEALAAERAALATAGDARAAGRLATDQLRARRQRLTLGLFRESDVRAAEARGQRAANCARRLVVLGTTEPGRSGSLEDVFNPRADLFVTPAYDEATWRARPAARPRPRAPGVDPRGGRRPRPRPGPPPRGSGRRRAATARSGRVTSTSASPSSATTRCSLRRRERST